MIIFVKEFSEYPGPRKETIGPNSGEKFRETVLYPALVNNPDTRIIVDLDGTSGYGSSFLEEAFGGLIRNGIPFDRVIKLVDDIVSTEDESLIDEIREYVTEAQEDING